MEDTIILKSSKRQSWLQDIATYKESCYNNIKEGSIIELILPLDLNTENFEPFHIVSLVCFIEHLHQLGCSLVRINTLEDGVWGVIDGKLKMPKYFQQFNPSDHEESGDSTILNLWKVVENKTYEYGISVSKYFSNTHFEGLDITSLSVAMDEIYANIVDHSESKNNAFSYIMYNPTKRKICVAACDFGLGIPTTLRNSGKSYADDSEALRDSIKIGVTARSTTRNKGFGLDNIISSISPGDCFRIVSNKSLLACFGNKNDIKVYKTNFDFKGTLIYFELSIDSFPAKDFEDDVTFFN